MPSRGRKFITEFLLPSLNDKRFGSRLMWLDIEKKVFQIQWNHKSASDWTTNDAAVFAAWDKRKGHYKPDEKYYYCKSKQRFRAALYKFIKFKHITELNSEDKYTKIYCIGDGKNISETDIVIAKSEKENHGNKNSCQKVKQNPEDVVIDLNSIWNASLTTEPQENYFVVCEHEIKEDYCIEEEQVVTDDTDEFIQHPLHYENQQNYNEILDSLNNSKNKISARETSNMEESEDQKSLHVEVFFLPEANIYIKDNHLNGPISIEKNNFHDYTSRLEEWPNLGFQTTDEDLSFDLPF